MRLKRYQFKVTYKRGPTPHLADTFARAALPHAVEVKVTNFNVFRIKTESLGQQRNPGLTENTECSASNHHTKMAK